MPVRPDENCNGARATDRLFERRDPAQAGAKRAAVEEGAQALLAEPAVQLHGDVAVAVGIADEDVIGSAARHRASLFACAGRSIPPPPDSYSKPVAISSCAFELKLRSGSDARLKRRRGERPFLCNPRLQSKTAFSHFPPVHRADPEGQQRVDCRRPVVAAARRRNGSVNPGRGRRRRAPCRGRSRASLQAF